MIIKNGIIFVGVAGLLGVVAGCSQPLRTLMDVGAEQKAQQQYQQRQETLFYRLIKDIESERLKQGTDLKDITSRYGEPVILSDGTLVYQRPGDYFRATKVYLVFDEGEKLQSVKIKEASL